MNRPAQVIVRAALLAVIVMSSAVSIARTDDVEIDGYSEPNWSPDGRSLAFVAYECTVSRSKSRCNDEIYVMGADGSQPANLTHTPNVNEHEPRWSLDGAHIVYTGVDIEHADGIYVMNADGASVIQLGVFPSRLRDHPSTSGAFDWSPDGKQVVSVSTDGENTYLYTIHVDGSRRVRLIEEPVDQFSPAWSPDGQWIAFVSNVNAQSDIFLIHPDGTGLTNLTDTPERSEVLPAWSPDATQMAFSAEGEFGNWGVEIVNADGSDMTVLAENVAGIYPPRLLWSPDGTNVALAVATGMMSHILVLSVDSGASTFLTEGMDSRNGEPAWSPDGTRLAFWSDLGMQDNIYLTDPDGSNRIQLTGKWQAGSARRTRMCESSSCRPTNGVG